MPSSPLRLAALLLALAGCATTATPIYPLDVSAGTVGNDMRRLETEQVVLYYPAARHEQALRFAARLEDCTTKLRGKLVDPADFQKVVVLLPETPINNAYVSSSYLGVEEHMVVPPQFETEVFPELGITPSPGLVACHEAVHFVQMQQIKGLSWLLRGIFGELYTPQFGFDSWFTEGLATYYESQLVPGTGRAASPRFRGYLHAGLAGKEIDGGDLYGRRIQPNSAPYMMGSLFVEYLATTYGEQKLWELVEVQSRAWLFPIATSVRFQEVYGADLSELIDGFDGWLRQRFPVREKPASQRTIREAGGLARYYRAADGTEVLLSSDLDEPVTLRVWGPDGTLHVEHSVTEVLPGRTHKGGGVSGTLSLSPDGRELFFTQLEPGETFERVSLVALDLARGTTRLVSPAIDGNGGSLDPDGRTYLFSAADGDRFVLRALDLATGAITPFVTPPIGLYLSPPRVSADGARVVTVADRGAKKELWVLDRRSGAILQTISRDGPIYEPSFTPDGRLLYSSTVDGRLQIFLHVPGEPNGVALTDAPYFAAHPFAAGGTVRFLDRRGWAFTIDEVALPAVGPRAGAETETAEAGVAVAAEEAGAATGAAAETGAEEPAKSGPPAATATPYGTPERASPGVDAELPTPKLISDERASAFDGLFVPRLHAPGLVFSDGFFGASLGLAGNDRLGRNRWALAAGHVPEDGTWDWAASWANTSFAPFWLIASVEQRASDSLFSIGSEGAVAGAPYRRERHADLALGRSFAGQPLDLGLSLAELDADGIGPRRWYGPTLGASWSAGEGTAYAGVRRGFGVDGRVTAYLPLTDVQGVLDVGLGLFAAVPAWPSSRASFRLLSRLRLLPGGEGEGLLVMGGFQPTFSVPIQGDPTGFARPVGGLPPRTMFFEALRGYEDAMVRADRASVNTLVFHLPIPIDEGSASSLLLFGPTFAYQLELQAFASLAHELDDASTLHAAAGGSLGLRADVLGLPLLFRLQAARRLVDDRALSSFFFVEL